MRNPASICIIRLSSLGDIVLLTPMIRVLRKQWPNARIDMIVAEQFSEVLKYNPRLDNVYTVQTNSGIRRLLAEKKRLHSLMSTYDLVIDAHGSIRSRILRIGLGKSLVSYDKFRKYKLNILKYKTRIPLQDIIPIPHRYFTALSGYQSVQPDDFGAECWLPLEEEKQKYLAQKKSQATCIAIAPGAHHATKRWPAENFEELIRLLHQYYLLPIVLLGGIAEKELCETIANNSEGKAISQAGILTLEQTIAVLDKSTCFIGNDSGLLHVASSRNIPVTVIYGSTVPEFGFIPYKTDYTIASLDLPCKPCTHIGKKKCPEGHFNCMNQLTPAMVFEKVQSLIQKSGENHNTK